MDGDVTTGMLGADVEGERWLAGVALSRSDGDGSFTLTSRMASNRDEGEVESRLTGVYPYARLSLSERVSAWALAGYGTGELTLTESGGKPIETDLSMTMGAVGGRGTLVAAPEGRRLRACAPIRCVLDADGVGQDRGHGRGRSRCEPSAASPRCLAAVRDGRRDIDAERGAGLASRRRGRGDRYRRRGRRGHPLRRKRRHRRGLGARPRGARGVGLRGMGCERVGAHRAGRSGCGRSPTPGTSRRTGSSRPGTVSTRRSATVSAHRAVSGS